MPQDMILLKGVGEKRAELFAKRIKTVKDLFLLIFQAFSMGTERKKKDIADCIEGETSVREHYRFFAACQRNKSSATK